MKPLEKRTRGICILQLCIVFTLFAWICSQPYMGELLTIKSKMLLLQEVIGVRDHTLLGPENDERLEGNAEKFSQLPELEKGQIMQKYGKMQEASRASFWLKLKRAFTILFFHISRFELLWIALGITIPVLLLLNAQGARHAAWLLPLLALAYGFENQTSGAKWEVSEDDKLFPSEQYLIEKYVGEPFSANISLQYEQLHHGWEMYLIEEWTKEKPSAEPVIFEQQVDQGNYAFNKARSEKLSMSLYPEGMFKMRKTLLILILYFAWNFFFAYAVNTVHRAKECQTRLPGCTVNSRRT